MASRFDKRAIRWLVRLLPIDLRDAHGAEMEQVLRAANRDRPRGVVPGLVFWCAAAIDILRVAPRQHAAVLFQDLRYAWRGLRRSPGFAIAALSTIALGTGATLAVFAVVNAVLLRPFPFADSFRLALVWAVTPSGSRTWLSAPEIEDLAARTRTFEGVAGLSDLRMAMTSGGVPEELDVVAASATLFPLLGVRPHLGRLFEAADDVQQAAPVVVLSHGLWTRRFGGAPAVVGTSITLDGRAYTVAGVLPRSFDLVPPSSVFPRSADAWVALQPHLVSRGRDVRFLHAIARVRTGIALDTARQEVASIGGAVARDFPDAYRGCCWTFDAVSMQHDVVSGVKPALLVLMGTVTVVLIITCVNVAALLLARAQGRRREMAIRAALGASRARLMRQLLTETLLLAAVGGGVGLILALAAPEIARVPVIGGLPRFSDVSVDRSVVAVAVILAVLTALLLAFAPILELPRRDGAGALDALRSSARSRNAVRVGRILAGSEVALAAVVLVLALLFGRSLAVLIDRDPGFTSTGVSTARVSLPPEYARADVINRFFDDVIRNLATVPGVDAAGAVTQLPLSGAMLGTAFTTAEGDGQDSRLDVDLRGVTPEYFRALNIALERGRGFAVSDGQHTPAVAVVDEIAAQRMWPGQDPIGQRMRWIRQPDVPIEVVGVVAPVRHRGVEQPARATVYRPHTQYARSTMYLVARTVSGQPVPASVLTAAVQSVDPNQPVAEISTMADLRRRSLARPGFGAALGGVLALLALALTTVGVYGLYAFTVVQRQREVGVRLAVGGSPSRVERLIMADGLLTALAGLCAGLPLAAAVARWTEGAIAGSVTVDGVTIGTAAAVMLLVAGLACWVPARQASRVDPAIVLRADT